MTAYSTFGWLDIREPTLRAHESQMEQGSRELLVAMWKRHPQLMRQRTGRMVGP